MTIKDKALNLLKKLAYQCPFSSAIIVVEEIIDAIDEIDPVPHSNITSADLDYWKGVKQELLKIKNS